MSLCLAYFKPPEADTRSFCVATGGFDYDEDNLGNTHPLLPILGAPCEGLPYFCPASFFFHKHKRGCSDQDKLQQSPVWRLLSTIKCPKAEPSVASSPHSRSCSRGFLVLRGLLLPAHLSPFTHLSILRPVAHDHGGISEERLRNCKANTPILQQTLPTPRIHINTKGMQGS